MNKVMLIGRIANEIEIKKTISNKSICEFNLAVDKGFKDEEGNKLVDFIRISCWNNNADFLGNYACKGALISVVGKISTSNYVNQQGEKIYKTFVSAENVELLSKPKNAVVQADNQKAVDEYKTKQNITFKEDDLPFY